MAFEVYNYEYSIYPAGFCIRERLTLQVEIASLLIAKMNILCD